MHVSNKISESTQGSSNQKCSQNKEENIAQANEPGRYTKDECIARSINQIYKITYWTNFTLKSSNLKKK